VFYKPEKEWTGSSVPYERYAAEEEYKYAAAHQLIDTVKAKKILKIYENEKGEKYPATEPINLYLSGYHFMDLLIWAVWGGIALLIIIIRMIIPVRKP
jgi:hypothetical protein